MIRRLIILLLIVGCEELGIDTDSNLSSCILIVDENFQICTEELNETECYSYYTFHNTFWSNTSSCNELNYSTEFDPCLNIEDTYQEIEEHEDTYQEITHCDIDWYLNDISEWICTTNYIFPTMAVSDTIGVEDIQDTVLFFENRIYDSIDECESVCPNEPLEVTTIHPPDGTGEYFTMYCSLFRK